MLVWSSRLGTPNACRGDGHPGLRCLDLERTVQLSSVCRSLKCSDLMHAVDLAELAIALVRNTPVLVSLQRGPKRETVNSYWLASRFRHEEWSGRLARHRIEIQRPGATFREQKWHEIYPVIQEVLLSEPLTRCVAYHATVLEQRRIDFDFVKLANTALVSQIEARNRCLNLIVFGQGLSVNNAVRLNRLRRKMESLTDQLIAAMHPVDGISDFCFDAARTIESQRELGGGRMGDLNLRIHLAGLSEELRRDVRFEADRRCSSARLNLRQSHIVLEMLGNDMFDSFGVPKSQLAASILSDSAESSGVQDDLISPVAHPLDVLKSKDQRPIKQPLRRWE